MKLRCSKCGGELLPNVEQIDLGLGGIMHGSCYEAWLKQVERGVMGENGEDDELVEREQRATKRTKFLDHANDNEKNRRLAYERACHLFGREAAERSYGRKNHET